MVSHRRSNAETWQCRNCGAALAQDAPSCHYCKSPVATARCRRCLHVGQSHDEFCTRCGERMRVLEESTGASRPCPSCREPLVAGTADELALASCQRCGGVWLDRDTFARLCREHEAQAAMLVGPWMERGSARAARPATPHRYRPCPVCRKFMNRSNFAKYSGIILDTCGSHGTFFDARELPALVQFIRHGGMDRAREREREALREEQRRLSALRRVSPTSAAKGIDDLGLRERSLDALLRELFSR